MHDMHVPVIEPIDVHVRGDKDASTCYHEVFKCTRNRHGDDRKRFRLVIDVRAGDRYIDVWSELHLDWHRVFYMPWEHDKAEVKCEEDVYKGGKWKASDFKACRDELVRVALAVVYG